MSTVILLNRFGNIKLARVNEVENKNAFIYDIGFGEFDHHQKEFDLRHDSGVKYASFGLLFKKYGMDYLNKILKS